MKYRKTFNRITLVALSTIAVIFFMCAITLHTAEADSLFYPAVHYGAGDGPNSVAIGDLNGDGDPDLAVANSDNVSVLLGNGDGTFQTAVNYGGGSGYWPESVAIGDLNGDGNQDLAVGLEVLGDCVSVLLGNGDGTFQTAVNYGAYDAPLPINISVPDRAESIAIGDFNGDGDPDLAVSIWSYWSPSFVSVLLGNGDGTFQTALNYGVGDLAHSVAIGDLNGDGDSDLAVANGGSSYVSVLHGVSVLLGNGDGTFQSAVSYGTGDEPWSVAIGDLNGDGNPDLAAANWQSDNVSVLLGNGDGTFQDAVNYSAGDRPNSVAIGDLNGDGDLDLAVANGGSDNVSVLLGNGDGTFQSAVDYGAGNWPQSVAIGDFNGDDDPDLAVANSDNVSILINTGGAAKLLYTPVTPCRIVDTRKTSAGMIGASTERDFHVFGDGGTIGAQGGNSAGCPAPSGEPVAALINLVVAHPTGKGNMQAFATGGEPGANLGVNFADIGSNRANAGIVKTSTGSGPDITVASRYSSAHAVIDVLGYYYPDGDLLYTPVTPCRIADTRKSGGKIGAYTQRDFHVYGDGATIGAQGGTPFGCPAPMVEPLAAHINLVAANPTCKGNLQAYSVEGTPGANLGVNFANIGTNFANAGTVQTKTGAGPDITVTSRFSSTHAVVDVLGYYYPDEGLTYTPVTPCRIADTRKTSAGIIDAFTQRNFHVFGDSSTISAQGGDPVGCPAPMGEPLAAHINMVAADPTGKGRIQADPFGEDPGFSFGVNFAAIGTNFANAGIVGTAAGAGPDITVFPRWSSTHAVIDVLGYYYPAP